MSRPTGYRRQLCRRTHHPRHDGWWPLRLRNRSPLRVKIRGRQVAEEQRTRYFRNQHAVDQDIERGDSSDLRQRAFRPSTVGRSSRAPSGGNRMCNEACGNLAGETARLKVPRGGGNLALDVTSTPFGGRSSAMASARPGARTHRTGSALPPGRARPARHRRAVGRPCPDADERTVKADRPKRRGSRSAVIDADAARRAVLGGGEPMSTLPSLPPGGSRLHRPRSSSTAQMSRCSGIVVPWRARPAPNDQIGKHADAAEACDQPSRAALARQRHQRGARLGSCAVRPFRPDFVEHDQPVR